MQPMADKLVEEDGAISVVLDPGEEAELVEHAALRTWRSASPT